MRTSFEVEIQYVNSSDHINTSSKHCHAWVISENVGNLLIFWEKVLYLGPKLVCAVEVTMYVDWTCMNVNRKAVHAWMISCNGKDMYMY